MDRSWLDEAKQDIGQWSASMPKDADNQPIDWQWVASLDMRHGIGAAARQHIGLLPLLRSTGAPSAAEPRISARWLHDLLKNDLAIRDRLEAIIAQCNSTFMTDFDRLIASYRLPRALAYANRRLCDEIAVLRRIGVDVGLWTIVEERRERVTVPVLRPGPQSSPEEAPVDDIQDRTADIVNGRAARRAAERRQRRASDYAVSRANLIMMRQPPVRMGPPLRMRRIVVWPITVNPIGATLICPGATWTASWASISRPRVRIQPGSTSLMSVSNT